MATVKTLQQLFERHRRPGDLVFAVFFLIVALVLLYQLPEQTKWFSKRTKLVAQPAFWPALALGGMVLFAALHLLGSLLSPRIYGRLKEVSLWLRSIEYALWFMAYVWLVPQLGYLPSTVLFMPLLAWRVGFRDRRLLGGMALLGVAVVLLFKTFLAVKIPGGALYEYLPDALRSTMLLNF